jgi:putative heme transporter
MGISGRALVRRWGGRAVGLAITGIGLYVVAPSLLTMFGAWPQLAGVDVPWFFILAVLQLGRLVALWWLLKMAIEPTRSGGTEMDRPDEVVPRLGWGTTATAQLAGSAAAKVIPGGGAAGGVVQAKVLISAGQPGKAVGSGLAAVGLLNNAVLFLLPVLTIPALLIGPPPAKQLQLGLLVSVVLAAAIVAVGVTALSWPRVVTATGRGIGRVVHVVRRSVTPAGVADGLLAQRDRIADAFRGRWWRSVFAAAATRMFDYASLVAALVAFDAHARPADVLLAFVVAQALAVVPITPGGVGVVDAGLTAMLVLIGIPADTAIIGTLLYRLFSFWLPIPIGAFAWAGWRISRRA